MLMYQEEMESSLLSLTKLEPVNFGEKDSDERTKFYHAQDKRNGQKIFVKKIDLSKDTYGEYQHEIDALSSLKGNFNIVRLVESGIESLMIGDQMQQFGFILLDLVGEIDLCDALTNYRWKYNEEDFISFSYKLIETIHFIHSNGYIHRDMKLENIVLDLCSIDKETGKFSFHPNSFSIIDFGSSFNSNDYFHNKDSQLSLTNFRRTQRYSPPEFINSGQLTEKYDIFSCGVILFSLVASHFPDFDYSIDQDGVFYEFLLDESIDNLFIPSEWENISEDIQILIKSMLAYDPVLRPTAKNLLKMDIFQNQISQCNDSCDEEYLFF